tara:strand:+ start:528 stop:773 length:246 start_codon:yes stop_codon:yes gene_type:complete
MEMIEGQKIKKLRNITKKELKREGWDLNNKFDFIPVLELENGVTVFPSRDSEGNGGGKLFGSNPKTKSDFHVIPEESMHNA